MYQSFTLRCVHVSVSPFNHTLIRPRTALPSKTYLRLASGAMPPALNEYGSFYDSEQNESSPPNSKVG
jgi:hypothetical protein